MAEEDGKTEEPTDHKLRKAREEGNVPKSEDLNGFMGILFAVVISIILAITYPDDIMGTMSSCFDTVWILAKNKYDITPECIAFANTLKGMAALMFAGMIFAAFTGYFIMNKGFVIPKQPLKFNIEALDIGTNLKNLVNKQNVVGMLISIVKESLFYSVFFLLLIFFFPILVYEMFCYLNCQGSSTSFYLYALIIAYTLIAFIFAAIDYPLKIRFWKDKLKMSHKDLKDEHKEMEGSPEVKQKQNEFRHELLEGAPSGPKNATFFVRGRDSIWGIRYNKDESPAPIIVAVGKDSAKANKIAQVAQNMRRLVISDDDFTDNLKNKAVMGRPVPLEYVAQVRKCIMQLRQFEQEHGPVHPGK